MQKPKVSYEDVSDSPGFSVHICSIFNITRVGNWFTLYDLESDNPIFERNDKEQIDHEFVIKRDQLNKFEIVRTGDMAFIRINDGRPIIKSLNSPGDGLINIGIACIGVYIRDFKFYIRD